MLRALLEHNEAVEEERAQWLAAICTLRSFQLRASRKEGCADERSQPARASFRAQLDYILSALERLEAIRSAKEARWRLEQGQQEHGTWSLYFHWAGIVGAQRRGIPRICSPKNKKHAQSLLSPGSNLQYSAVCGGFHLAVFAFRV
jgi:hypothetical protein